MGGNERRVLHVLLTQQEDRVGLMTRLARAGHDVRTFASLGEYVRARAERPDCILAGISAHDREALAVGHADRPGDARCAVIFVTRDADIRLAVGAMKAGACDVLPLPVDEATLERAIGEAFATSDTWRAADELHAQARSRLTRLTPRERAVFVRILRGERNKQIAAALDSQEATIKVHRSRLMRKLETRTLAELLHVGRELETFLAVEPEDTATAPKSPTRTTQRRSAPPTDEAISIMHLDMLRNAAQPWAGLAVR